MGLVDRTLGQAQAFGAKEVFKQAWDRGSEPGAPTQGRGCRRQAWAPEVRPGHQSVADSMDLA